MVSTEQNLESAISEWADLKSAHISLDSHRYELEKWTDVVGKTSVNHLVDVGCGSGLFDLSAVILGYAEQVTGIDPIERGHGTEASELDRTMQLANEMHLANRVSFVNGYWPDISVPRCDLLVFRKSLHHILEAGMTESELIRHLGNAQNHMTDGGHIYIMEPSPSYRIQWYIQQQYRSARGKGRLTKEGKLDVADWKSILHEAGFRDIQSVRIPPNLFISSRFPTSLTQVLSTTFLITGRS